MSEKIKIGETEYTLPFRIVGILAVDANNAPVSTEGFLDTVAQSLNEYFKPIDIITHCPKCHEQHIDAPDLLNCKNCGHDDADHFNAGERNVCGGGKLEKPVKNCSCDGFEAWDNPPHKTHRCASCNHVWKPADVPTNGVAELTKN